MEAPSYQNLLPTKNHPFVSDLLHSADSLPLPHVAGHPQRINLHDSGAHGGEIPGRLQAHPLQVGICSLLQLYQSLYASVQ